MLPPRVNEIVGVSHVKAYIFDDVLLVSGANLSSDYFTRRQVQIIVQVTNLQLDASNGYISRLELTQIPHRVYLEWQDAQQQSIKSDSRKS